MGKITTKLVALFGIVLYSAAAYAADLDGKNAAVDMTIFGMTLGKPLSIPNCENDRETASVGLCFKEPPKEMPSSFEVMLTRNKMPGWLQFDANDPDTYYPVIDYVIDGVLEGATIKTSGIKSIDDVMSDLRGKYGKPTEIKRTKVKTTIGAEFESVSAKWILPSLYVSYDGTADSIDLGLITILTPKGLDFLNEQDKTSRNDRRL